LRGAAGVDSRFLITFHPDNVAAIFFARSFTLAPAMPETIHN